MPKQGPSLLLADRLYGGAGFIASVLKQAPQSCDVLIRVAAHKNAKVIEAYSDGSALVRIRVGRGKSKQAELLLREIRVRTQRPAETTSVERRLWTTLLDASRHPAHELAELYTQRWEVEGFFRELKATLGRENLLRATSLPGAQIEFGALIMAASMMAEERLSIAQEQQLPPQRLSIVKIGQTTSELVRVLAQVSHISRPHPAITEAGGSIDCPGRPHICAVVTAGRGQGLAGCGCAGVVARAASSRVAAAGRLVLSPGW